MAEDSRIFPPANLGPGEAWRREVEKRLRSQETTVQSQQTSISGAGRQVLASLQGVAEVEQQVEVIKPAVSDAQNKADEALAEAAKATETADGKNRITASQTEPTYENPQQGDLWYVTDESGRVLNIRIYNGTQWNPHTLVADSVLVPGSVGATLIEDGAITTPKISVGSIELEQLKAGHFEEIGTPIESGDWTVSVRNDAGTNPVMTYEADVVTDEDGSPAFRVNITSRGTTSANPRVIVTSPRFPVPLGGVWRFSISSKYPGKGASDNRPTDRGSTTFRVRVRNSSGTLLRTILAPPQLSWNDESWEWEDGAYFFIPGGGGIPAGSTVEWEITHLQASGGGVFGAVFDRPVSYRGGITEVGSEAIYFRDGVISSETVTTGLLVANDRVKVNGVVDATGDVTTLGRFRAYGGDPSGLNPGSFDGVTLSMYIPEGQAGSPPGIARVFLTGSQMYAMREAASDTGWVDLSPYLSSGFSGMVRVRRVGKNAMLSGQLTGSVPSASSVTDILTAIPEEWRAGVEVNLWGTAWWQGYTGACGLRQNGTVFVSNRSGTTWSGNSFQFTLSYLVQ